MLPLAFASARAGVRRRGNVLFYDDIVDFQRVMIGPGAVRMDTLSYLKFYVTHALLDQSSVEDLHEEHLLPFLVCSQ